MALRLMKLVTNIPTLNLDTIKRNKRDVYGQGLSSYLATFYTLLDEQTALDLIYISAEILIISLLLYYGYSATQTLGNYSEQGQGYLRKYSSISTFPPHKYQSQPHYQPGDYHSPVYSYIADFPSKYSGNVQPQHNSLRLRPDGSFVPEYSASRPSYKYQGSHLGNQFRLFSDGSYQPSAPQSSPPSYYESTHSNINQFYNSPNKYTFSDGVFQDNSNTKSKHFDKDYLYPDILADHYEKHFKHSNKESEPAHSQVKYENSSPDWYYYGGPSEDVKEDYSYDNWNKITIKNSESSSESLGNTGNINLKEQNNQAWNTLTDFSPSFSHLGFDDENEKLETGKLEKILTSDPYQQFPNSPNYINQDQEPEYAFYENYENSSSDVKKSVLEDYRNGNNYVEEYEYYYDYADYDYHDYNQSNNDDQGYPWNWNSDEELKHVNVREGEDNPIKDTKYPEEANNSKIKYSESYSKMNLANNVTTGTEIPYLGTTSSYNVDSLDLTVELNTSEPVLITEGEVEITGDTANVWSNRADSVEDVMVVTPITDINQYDQLTEHLNLQDIHNFTYEGFNLIDLYKETLNKRTATA